MPTPGVAKTSTPDAAAGNPVDIVTLDAGAGTVDRQVFALGDPTTATRYLVITATGAALVDGSGVTQPVSLAAIPLPAGAATDATPATGFETVTNLLRQQTAWLRAISYQLSFLNSPRLRIDDLSVFFDETPLA
jgi:hypothetical protein